LQAGDDGLKIRLLDFLSDVEKVAVIGVGNRFRRDDYVGVEIVRELRDRLKSDRVLLIACETAPEEHIESIVEFKPSHILIIDAGMMGLKPGGVRLIDFEDLAIRPAVSTHMLPLRIFCELVEEMTGARIALLSIQPRDISLGEGLTPELEGAARGIALTLLKVLKFKSIIEE